MGKKYVLPSGFTLDGKRLLIHTPAGVVAIGERDLSKMIGMGGSVGGKRYGQFLLGTGFSMMCGIQERELTRCLKLMWSVVVEHAAELRNGGKKL